jgi:hypothetical protein
MSTVGFVSCLLLFCVLCPKSSVSLDCSCFVSYVQSRLCLWIAPVLCLMSTVGCVSELLLFCVLCPKSSVSLDCSCFVSYVQSRLCLWVAPVLYLMSTVGCVSGLLLFCVLCPKSSVSLDCSCFLQEQSRDTDDFGHKTQNRSNPETQTTVDIRHKTGAIQRHRRLWT